jgi:branched-chain amino acid transport system substrate-binding protein
MGQENYIKNGGTATEGDYASSFGAPTEKLDSAAQFVKDYKAAGFNESYGPYGSYSYDAANAIIKALKKALEENKTGQELRDEVTKEVGESDFDGVTGHISFDEFGDTNLKVLTVNQVKGGKVVPGTTEEFK